MTEHHLAIDLGAGSGRAIHGVLEKGRLALREIHRFQNSLVEADGRSHWDVDALRREIFRALKRCADEGLPLRSVGVDA